MIRVLSIDGGGIRGIIPAIILAELERCTGRPVARLFDFVAGTSSGGITALALLRPGAEGLPRYTAAEVVALYEREGPRIFDRPLRHRIHALGNLIEEKYPAEPLERVLHEYLGDARLAESLVPVLLPSYEIERREPVFFKSHRAIEEPGRDFWMRDAARATSAAPTYFEPARITPVGGGAPLALVDGGVYANNPMLCAWVEVRGLFPGPSDVLICSLGTGELTRPIPYERARGWGVIEWAQPLLQVVFDGISDTVDYQMRQLLPPGPDRRPRYHRFQAELVRGSDDLDDARPANLRTLKRVAEEILRREAEAFRTLCEQLVEADRVF